MDAAVDLNPALVVVMPLLLDLRKFLALLVGLKVEILGIRNEAVGTQRHIALHAGFCQGFGGRVGIVVQVGNGGDAKTQALGNAQKGGSLGAAAIHPALLLQLLGQSLGALRIIHIAS